LKDNAWRFLIGMDGPDMRKKGIASNNSDYNGVGHAGARSDDRADGGEPMGTEDLR
jgi:hypothetical protein